VVVSRVEDMTISDELPATAGECVAMLEGVSDGLCKRSVLKEDQDDRCDH
jgi:hypothetical protein